MTANETATPGSVPPQATGRGLAFKLAALGLVVVSALAGTGLARWLAAPEPQPTTPAQNVKAQFQTWPKPDLTLILTAQMHGYLLPCGCSRPQIGGLERRYNLMQMILDKGWRVLPLDLGDVAQKEGPAKLPNLQGKIKFVYALRALKMMGYTGLGLGEYETALPTFDALGEILNARVPPIILGNLEDPNGGLREAMKPHLSRWSLMEDPASKLRIGVTSIIGSGVAARIKDQELKISESAPALKQIVKEMDAAQLNYRVLLYQGSLTRGKRGFQSEAVEVAKAFPSFDLVVCQTEEEEPPANPTRVKHAGGGETLVLGIGHKGRYVGVLGLYKKPGGGFETRWELVQMTEAFLTPEAQRDKHPIVNLLEDYTKELRDRNYLSRAPRLRHPSQVAIEGKKPVFVGSEKCKKCHEHAHDIWSKTPHSHAYATLEDPTLRPGNRQYDPECIVCHTVGFGYDSGFRDEKQTPLLKNVGCESCHGPCSEHVRTPLDATWYPLINPYRPTGENETADEKKKRMSRIDQFCQKCHDIDNDVTWSHVGFEKKWAKIAHPTPKPE